MRKSAMPKDKDLTSMSSTEFCSLMDKKFPGMMQNIFSQNSWIIECGPGWYGLIYDLTSRIYKIDKTIKVVQVKEKFAELRFYLSGARGEILNLVTQYEDMSLMICEVCGKYTGKDNRTKGGWIHNMCHVCLEEYNKKRKHY